MRNVYTPRIGVHCEIVPTALSGNRNFLDNVVSAAGRTCRPQQRNSYGHDCYKPKQPTTGKSRISVHCCICLSRTSEILRALDEAILNATPKLLEHGRSASYRTVRKESEA